MDMFVLIYSVFIYFYVNVEANRIKERNPHYETFTFYDQDPSGSWGKSVAYSSSSSSAVRSSEPVVRPHGTAAKPTAPFARVPFRSRFRSVGSAGRSSKSAFSSTSTSGGNRAQAFASSNPMDVRSDCHKSTWSNTDSGHYHCNGDRNATYKNCPNPCPPTCINPLSGNPCYAICLPNGCECNPGFVLSDEGKCILYQDCPGVLCNGDRNATYKQCPDPCPSTCALLGITRVCNKACLAYGCECNEGYHLNDEGKCIRIQDCPGALCNGDRNATFKECPNPCPRTCELPSGPEACIASCAPRGCECNEGYYLNDKGKCVQLQDCPGALCNGDRNATFKECPNPCPRTCELPSGTEACIASCAPRGCECNEGYYLNDKGKCVQLQDCPGALCNGDRNATFKECPNPCPRTCELPSGPEACIASCAPRGCECNEGYYLNDKGKCVQLQDCPGAKLCSANETFVYCKAGCPTDYCPVADSRAIIACDPPSPCPSGCVCKGDYLKLSYEDDTCILATECPPFNCTRPNEVWSKCPPACLYEYERCNNISPETSCDARYHYCRPQCVCKTGFCRNDSDICVPKESFPPLKCSINETEVECKRTCPPQSCEISYTEYSCPNVSKCERGCDCLPNYLRNASGVCILNDECPPPPLKCSSNETEVECKRTCPPQSCEISYTEYSCPNVSKCERGCDCIPNYLRNASGVCILNDECPPPLNCGEFEVPSLCRIKCPPQTCDSIFTTYDCKNQTCEAGCDCIDGYLRNRLGVCIPSLECFLEPECDISEECRPTCSNPAPKNCSTVIEVPMENVDGCKCKEGFILSDVKGNCIEIANCPDGCNGDLNAIATACPWPCPSACDCPNASSCGQKCKTVGCQCKPGFILSEKKGKCVLPDDCESGNPCGVNGTYSDCSFRCPNQYCPEDDSQSIVACKPGRPCPPGCMCKEYYRRTSFENDACILAQDCPVITCTRPNEVFNPCASECLAENCRDLQTINDCVPDPKNCQPKCVCSKGYYRNEVGDCVPKSKCPNQCDVPQNCRPTCTVPNPPNCEYIQPSETNNECNCQSGYILDVSGGTCIKIGDCPVNQTCNGDPNASIKECPQSCPSTCLSPNATPCKKKCIPVGCECNAGYILSNDGVCVLPDQCEGGNPCGPNATFVPCKSECPTDYCPTDDSRAVVVCEKAPFAPCYSGCNCKLNHRRLSVEDPRCILSMECPPLDCITRPNEIWNPCPPDCLREYCEDVDKPPVVCNTLVLNCNPKCICDKTYFRNSSDICVSSPECRKLNEENKKEI